MYIHQTGAVFEAKGVETAIRSRAFGIGVVGIKAVGFGISQSGQVNLGRLVEPKRYHNI